MLKDIFIYKNIIFDNKLEQLENLQEHDNVVSTVYEVFKIIGGNPVFINDHLQRLEQSLLKISINYKIDFQQIKNNILELCNANETYLGNMELLMFCCADKSVKYCLGFIKHKYPDVELYSKGVETQVLNVVRENPNVKIKDTSSRKKADDYLKKSQVYEVLLANEKHELTEGSRSNLFFIKGTEFYTAPDNVVLKGITRLKTIEIIKKQNWELIYQPVIASEIGKYDACFICGTSPAILPISTINNVKFDVQNNILQKLMLYYNKVEREM